MYIYESNEKDLMLSIKKSQKSQTEKNRLMGTGLLDMYSAVYLSDCFTIYKQSNPNSVSL